MKYALILSLWFLTACGQNYNRPRSLYVSEFISVSPEIQEVVGESVDTINGYAGSSIINIFGGGEKPVLIKSINPAEIDGDTFAHARYLEYQCVVQIRTDLEDMIRENINPNFPQTVPEATWKAEAAKIVMHELGHCAGFTHSNDSMDLMYFSYNPSWNTSTLSRFVEAFKEATREQ